MECSSKKKNNTLTSSTVLLMCLMKIQESINSNNDLTLLENSLILSFRPSFLHITSPDIDNDIQVLISTRHFNAKNVHERIIMVYNLIKKTCPKVLEDRLVVVQAYTPIEMDDVLEYVFNDEQTEGD